MDVRLFHESRCRLVHKYRVYKDPFPHPAVRGGGGGGASPFVVLCDLRYGCRAVVESTHIDSEVGSIPGGGARGVLSAQRVFPWADGPPLCFTRQFVHPRCPPKSLPVTQKLNNANN